jgi:hypothetical protein
VGHIYLANDSGEWLAVIINTAMKFLVPSNAVSLWLAKELLVSQKGLSVLREVSPEPAQSNTRQ